MLEEKVWYQKYRPQTIDDVILPEAQKKQFKRYVEEGFIPSLLLVGSPGCGKTTLALAAIKELGSEYLFIEASLENGIDVLRNKISQFASSLSFSGIKYVILDEADRLTVAMQEGLRSFMETFSANCGFILTANNKNKISPALLDSRCTLVEFVIPEKEKNSLNGQMYKSVCKILDAEGVKYTKEVLGRLVIRYSPNWRGLINKIQSSHIGGELDVSILAESVSVELDALVECIRKKDFTNAVKWVSANSDGDIGSIYTSLYFRMLKELTVQTSPAVTIIIAEYQYKAAFVTDQEINLVACVAEIMGSSIFK